MTKALFWDFDGTLLHPNEAFLHALLWAFDGARRALRPACSWYRPETAYPHQTGPLWGSCFPDV